MYIVDTKLILEKSYLYKILYLLQNQLVRMKIPCHIIEIRKDIRAKIGKQLGDIIKVTIVERVVKK